MNDDRIEVEIDGRPTALGAGPHDGAAILAAARLAPAEEHLLVRIDGGAARLVEPDAVIDLAAVPPPGFRTFRYGRLRHLVVDGVVWDWGDAAILETDVRHIAGMPRGSVLRRDGHRAPVRHASMIDLTTETMPHLSFGQASVLDTMVPVVVNGRPREVAEKELDFGELVALAFPDLTKAGQRSLTVTWRRGHADRPEGSVVPHQRLRLHPGQVINVTATTKS